MAATGISKTSHFSAFVLTAIVVVVLSLFQPARAADVASSVLRLPSQGGGEVRDVCGGAASPAASCPVNCFRADPVCGVDGVTYWCGCSEAACAGAEVAKLGFCEVGNGGSTPLSGQALLLVHIVWLIVLGFSVFFGLF